MTFSSLLASLAHVFHSELDIWIPQPFHAEVPVDWWDSEADKSLLIGVFKHGKEHGDIFTQVHALPRLAAHTHMQGCTPVHTQHSQSPVLLLFYECGNINKSQNCGFFLLLNTIPSHRLNIYVNLE